MKTLWSARLVAAAAMAIYVTSATSGCARSIDKTDRTETSAEQYELVKSLERVKRMDCSGNVISDRLETVSSPTRLVMIVPQTESELVASSFYNRTTGSQPNCKIGLTQFQIDASPSFCNMQVAEGINELEYAFHYCTSWRVAQLPDGSTTRTCVGTTEVREAGSVFIKILYREETTGRSQTIYPQCSECAYSSSGVATCRP